MNSMRCTKSQSAFLLAIIMALIFLSASLSAADFKATGYETPAYIDIEFGELRVNEAAGSITINIFRSGDFRQSTTVEYRTSEIEASEGKDYKATGGTLIFQPGEGFKTLTLEILVDGELEGPESFLFELTGAGPNTVLGRSSAVIWIDDGAPGISQPSLEIATAPNNQIVLAWSGEASELQRTADPINGWEKVETTPT
ncbi:MAG: Calx-beta domain-containing protein, partial [Limisphaerales bacterium]